MLYEYALTLKQEARQYWGRPVNLPTALFFTNRYLCLPNRIIVLTAIFAGPSHMVNICCSCHLNENG